MLLECFMSVGVGMIFEWLGLTAIQVRTLWVPSSLCDIHTDYSQNIVSSIFVICVMLLINAIVSHFCVWQKRQHVFHPTFASADEVMLSTSDARKGCWIQINDKDGHVFLPSVNAVGFSHFSFSLLRGNGNMSLSLKCVFFRILTLFRWSMIFWLDINV